MAIQIVSANAIGDEGNAASYTSIGGRRVSDDGRFVVFYSQSTNLATGDLNGATYFDAFVKDMQTGTVSLLASSATGHSSAEAITPDGRYALVITDAALLPADTNGTTQDTYIKDLQTGTLSLLVSGADRPVYGTRLSRRTGSMQHSKLQPQTSCPATPRRLPTPISL